MAVRIRFSRIGKKNAPVFRLVAVDSRKKRDGAVLDTIATFDPVKGKIVQFNEELYQNWVAKGALPTDSAKKIYRMYKKAAPAAPSKKDEEARITAE